MTAPPAPAPQSKASSITSAACETGTFELVAAGFAGTSPTGIAYYKYCPEEKIAFVFLPSLTGTSDSNEFTAGPLPDFLVPATISAQEAIIGGFDNGVETQPLSVEVFAGDPTLHFNLRGRQEGWTPSGAKGAGIHAITLFLD